MRLYKTILTEQNIDKEQYIPQQLLHTIEEINKTLPIKNEILARYDNDKQQKSYFIADNKINNAYSIFIFQNNELNLLNDNIPGLKNAEEEIINYIKLDSIYDNIEKLKNPYIKNEGKELFYINNIDKLDETQLLELIEKNNLQKNLFFPDSSLNVAVAKSNNHEQIIKEKTISQELYKLSDNIIDTIYEALVDKYKEKENKLFIINFKELDQKKIDASLIKDSINNITSNNYNITKDAVNIINEFYLKVGPEGIKQALIYKNYRDEKYYNLETLVSKTERNKAIITKNKSNNSYLFYSNDTFINDANKTSLLSTEEANSIKNSLLNNKMFNNIEIIDIKQLNKFQNIQNKNKEYLNKLIEQTNIKNLEINNLNPIQRKSLEYFFNINNKLENNKISQHLIDENPDIVKKAIYIASLPDNVELENKIIKFNLESDVSYANDDIYITYLNNNSQSETIIESEDNYEQLKKDYIKKLEQNEISEFTISNESDEPLFKAHNNYNNNIIELDFKKFNSEIENPSTKELQNYFNIKLDEEIPYSEENIQAILNPLSFQAAITINRDNIKVIPLYRESTPLYFDKISDFVKYSQNTMIDIIDNRLEPFSQAHKTKEQQIDNLTELNELIPAIIKSEIYSEQNNLLKAYNKIDENKKNFEILLERNTELQDINKSLNKQVDDLNKKISSYKNTKTAMSRTIKDKEEQIIELKSKVETMQNEEKRKSEFMNNFRQLQNKNNSTNILYMTASLMTHNLTSKQQNELLKLVTSKVSDFQKENIKNYGNTKSSAKGSKM